MNPSLKITRQDNGERLDVVLARVYPQYSRSFFHKFLKKGGGTLLGTPREPDYHVHIGEVFQLADFEAFAALPTRAKDPDNPVDFVPTIIFEDSALLVIDKPAGLVVHPAPGHRVGTLMDWLKRHLGPSVLKVFTDPERLGLVHRLDKDTSGVLIIAKSIISQTAISRQFAARTVRKSYTAFVEGTPAAKQGIINAPVGRSRKVPTRMAISTIGRASETAFEVQESFGEVSHVNLYPKTGRTHQIRVHLSAIGHPIVGDRTYGAKSVWMQTYDIQRPLLHAEHLELDHPITGKKVSFSAPWPADFQRALTRFRESLQVAVVAFAMIGLYAFSSFAEEASAAKPSAAGQTTPRKTTAGASSSRTAELASEIKKLKKEFAELKAALAETQDSIEKLSIPSRLRDLEHAASELNSKAVSGSGGAEETKTQLLDISRRLKNQQETMDQMRDQIDRLNRSLIRQKAVETPSSDVTPSAAP